MEYPEFLQKLRETPRDWYITPGDLPIHGLAYAGRIRRLDSLDKQCPISSIMDDNLSVFDWVAKQLGLGNNLRDKIIYAADNDNFHDRSIRKDLLEACGLQEGM